MSRRSLTALLFVIDAALCFALCYVGLWYLVFIPSAAVGILLKPGWLNLVYFGLPGTIGVLGSIFFFQVSYRLEISSIVASIIGLPDGYSILLLLTALIAFLISGLGSMVTSSFR